MKSEKNTKPTIFIQNDNLPIVVIDTARISPRKDSLYYIQLGTIVPEGIREQFRMMIPKANLERVITALCRQSSYYPDKKIDETEMAKKEKVEQK